MKIIDLSISIENNLQSDPPNQRPHIDYLTHANAVEGMLSFFPGATKADLPDGKAWAVEHVNLTTHSGTHMDAPYHYHPTMNNGKPSRTIDEMPLKWCFNDAVVVDFSDRADGELIIAQDFKEYFKKINYTLKPFDIVLVRTGASAHWGSPRYLSSGCGMGRDATLYLIEQGVKVMGTDAWSWDRPLTVIAEEFERNRDKSIIWEGHYAGIEKEYYHMEKLTNLDKLPSFGFKCSCFPVKIHKASAGWVRAVAFLDK